MGGLGVRALRYTGIEGRLAGDCAWSLALGGGMTSGTGKNKKNLNKDAMGKLHGCT